ncbi:MAG: tetraacyldisaccharide 4'-kinase [Candidatus Aminicenantes bacterium]|nr:tetraacyldisaccharide 4'-kinase [Candidatus Aminicenantes bacterium]
MKALLLNAYSLISAPVCARKAAAFAKGRKKAFLAPLPVISVGNLALGGTGKTPVAAELIGRFLDRGYHPALVTRGYGGVWEKIGGVLSDGRSIFGGVREAGDEPVWFARRFPAAGVFVGRDRVLSCLKAEALGFDLCLLDDGFQHLRLARDLDIVLHHPSAGLPLREGERALSRAHILLLPRESAGKAAEHFRRRFPRLDVFEYEVVAGNIEGRPSEPVLPLSFLQGRRILAFAGIARPGRFFDLLESAGASLVGRLIFPDHYPYPQAGISRVVSAVVRLEPDLVLTTEKDAVKWRPKDRTIAGRPLHVLRIGIDLPETFFERVWAALPAVKAGRV